MPDSALSGWARFAEIDPSTPLFLSLVLVFIQLCGLIAFGGGCLKIIRYFSPGNPKAPATLSAPIFQMIFGLFALVPMRVVNLAKDMLANMGWL